MIWRYGSCTPIRSNTLDSSNSTTSSGFESLLFDEPHLIREVLIWICGWIPVFEVGRVEKTRQRHLADDAAAHQIVVCLNFSGDSSGKVGDAGFLDAAKYPDQSYQSLTP